MPYLGAALNILIGLFAINYHYKYMKGRPNNMSIFGLIKSPTLRLCTPEQSYEVEEKEYAKESMNFLKFMIQG